FIPVALPSPPVSAGRALMPRLVSENVGDGAQVRIWAPFAGKSRRPPGPRSSRRTPTIREESRSAGVAVRCATRLIAAHEGAPYDARDAIARQAAGHGAGVPPDWLPETLTGKVRR